MALKRPSKHLTRSNCLHFIIERHRAPLNTHYGGFGQHHPLAATGDADAASGALHRLPFPTIDGHKWDPHPEYSRTDTAAQATALRSPQQASRTSQLTVRVSGHGGGGVGLRWNDDDGEMGEIDPLWEKNS